MKIAIIGLGLMGGSLALACRGFRNGAVVGYDINAGTGDGVLAARAVDILAGSVTEAVADADISVFCTYPETIAEDILECTFKPGSVVTEICGVKHGLGKAILKGMPENVSYAGIHPMAGKEVDGFANADAGLFKNAGFIICRNGSCKDGAYRLLEELITYVGGRYIYNDSERHDEIIAYTSDLMHIAASCLCAKYPEDMTLLHTAGAFRDCTRVANLNPRLWTDLLLMNRENIIPWLDKYIDGLNDVRDALVSGEGLFGILETTSRNKAEMIKKGAEPRED